MVKYITFDSTSDGVIHVPLCSGLLAKYIDATTTHLYYIKALGSDATIDTGGERVQVKLTTTSATQALVDNINNAIEQAITSNWREVAHSVRIPSGEGVTSFVVEFDAL